MKRSNAVVGLLAILAAVSAIGFALMLSYYGRDGCLDGFGQGGSCPALAVVNGDRYQVGLGNGLVEDIEADLFAWGSVATTNDATLFADMTAYKLDGFDPQAVLIARANRDYSGGGAPFLILWGPRQDSIWPSFCDYLIDTMRTVMSECSAPA